MSLLRRLCGGTTRKLEQRGGFDFADRCLPRFLSRRDYRTQPGVLTPGTNIKGVRPEGGGREEFSALNAERDPQRLSAAPFLLRPLFPDYGAPSGRVPIVNVSRG
jgi:hypothetical protein